MALEVTLNNETVFTRGDVDGAIETYKEDIQNSTGLEVNTELAI